MLVIVRGYSTTYGVRVEKLPQNLIWLNKSLLIHEEIAENSGLTAAQEKSL
jgi:hypothetical protein